jgi:hypothetical protein
MVRTVSLQKTNPLHVACRIFFMQLAVEIWWFFYLFSLHACTLIVSRGGCHSVKSARGYSPAGPHASAKPKVGLAWTVPRPSAWSYHLRPVECLMEFDPRVHTSHASLSILEQGVLWVVSHQPGITVTVTVTDYLFG